MNKNAFEIRLDILKMAHDDAVGRYHHKISYHQQNADKLNQQYDPTLIESLFPTSADVLARAEELYKFVEGK
jgi:hypothetical protein